MENGFKTLLNAPSRVVLCGRDGLIVENSVGISGFTETGITLKIPEGALIVEGDNLVIVSADEGKVVVSGKVVSVSYA